MQSLSQHTFLSKKKKYKEIVIFHNEKVRFNVLKKVYIYMSPLVIKHFPIDAKFIVFELILYILYI